MLISITDQSKKKRKEYAKTKRPRDKVWVGQNPPKLEFGWVGVPASFQKSRKKRTPSQACLFPNWKWCPGIRLQFFSAGAKPTSPSPFNEGLIVPKPVTQRQQYLTVQVPFLLFLLCLWIIWGFDITNTRHSVSTHLKHLLNNMENFKELQGFPIHIPIQKTYMIEVYSVIPRLNAGRRLNAGLEKTPGQNCRFLNWQTRTKNF